MPSALVPAYKVEVSWSQQMSGLFTLGTSTFGGSAVMAASSWSSAFGGPYDDLTNPVAGIHVDRISVVRGREDDLTTMRAGEVTVSGRDTLGRLNPRNPASPIYGLVNPMRPIRVSVIYAGVSYPLAYMWTDRIDWQPEGGRGGTFQIHAVDFFSRLESFRPLLASIGQTTTGAAIGRILDAMSWTDPAMRRLAVGDTIPDFFTTQGILNSGTTSALTLIEDLLVAERGVVFIGRDGAVVYQSRNQRLTAPSAGTLTNVMENMAIASDLANVKNRWTVVRQDFTGATLSTQQASDTASLNTYGYQEDSIESPYLLNDNVALSLAQFMLAETRSPVRPVWDLPFNAAKDAATLLQAAQRDVGDRVTLVADRTAIGGTGDYYVEQVRHEIAGRRHDTTWRLSERPAGNPFAFGVSTFGGSDYLTY